MKADKQRKKQEIHNTLCRSVSSPQTVGVFCQAVADGDAMKADKRRKKQEQESAVDAIFGGSDSDDGGDYDPEAAEEGGGGDDEEEEDEEGVAGKGAKKHSRKRLLADTGAFCTPSSASVSVALVHLV